MREFGNGLCLPAGPLREPVSRLQQIDAVVLNGDAKPDHPLLSRCFRMGLKAEALVNLSTAERRPLGGAPFKIGTTIEAVAGLGNPERFFSLLEDLPYPIQTHSFPDHYQYRSEDFQERRIFTGQPHRHDRKRWGKMRQFCRFAILVPGRGSSGGLGSADAGEPACPTFF